MRVVVIGAGFAGLAAALDARLGGADVTVLEALPHPGGKAALGWADVPSGPTVVTMPHVLQAFAARVGLPPLPLRLATPLTRYAYPDGRVFAPELDVHATLTQLTPQEARDYTRLLNAARVMHDDAKDTFLHAPPPTLRDLARYAVTRGYRAAPHQPLARFVQSGPHLTPFWLRFATYMGANPYKAPAVLHNIAWVELGMGVWHLEGGFRALAEQLAHRATQLGVTFAYGTRVEKLDVQRGRVTRALTNRGAFPADYFISAADRAFTRAWLGLPPPREPLGISGFAVQIRLREAIPPGHFVYFPHDYRREWRDIERGDLPSDPTLYLHTNAESAFLLVNAPANPSSTDPHVYARHLLRLLQHRHPLDISEWNPLSPREYARTGRRGALYGSAPHGLTGALRPKWHFPGVQNLQQIGGTVHPGGGVPLCLISAEASSLR